MIRIIIPGVLQERAGAHSRERAGNMALGECLMLVRLATVVDLMRTSARDARARGFSWAILNKFPSLLYHNIVRHTWLAPNNLAHISAAAVYRRHHRRSRRAFWHYIKTERIANGNQMIWIGGISPNFQCHYIDAGEVSSALFALPFSPTCDIYNESTQRLFDLSTVRHRILLRT